MERSQSEVRSTFTGSKVGLLLRHRKGLRQELSCLDSPDSAIGVKDQDVISDDGQEIFNVLKSRSIENLLIMGVHTNVCVLGRPFGIRQMVYLGKNVVLVRDLTDRYNRAPGRHFAGISRTVAHIEKYWTPTTSSTFLTGLPEFRFEEDPRPHVVFLLGEKEYQTGKTLPELAVQELEPRGVRFSFVHADAQKIHRFPGLEVLDSADLLVLSVRRLNPPVKQLALIRKYLEAPDPRSTSIFRWPMKPGPF